MDDKLGILPKTIDSPIVMDGLSAVSQLELLPGSQGICLVVGGTAVQSYLPDGCRRPTSDIDISVVRPLNYAEFKEFAFPVVKYLSEKGYSIAGRKKNAAFKLLVHDSAKNDGLIIEFSRRNSRKFEKSKSMLERELEHGRRKSISSTDSSYLVASPEDIATPKIVRGIGTLGRYPNVMPELTQLYQGEMDLRRFLQYVIAERGAARESGVEARLEQARLKADLYDITSLSQFAGFNDQYLGQAFNEWNRTNTPTPQLEFIKQLLKLNI